MVIGTQVITKALLEAVERTLPALTGSEVSVDDTSLPKSGGMVAKVEIFGGWTGTLIIHAEEATLLFLTSSMSAVVSVRKFGRSEDALRLVAESVVHSFVRHFSEKSTISEVTVKPWAVFRESRLVEAREWARLYISIAGMPLTVSLTESLSKLSTE